MCGVFLVADRSDPAYKPGYIIGSECLGCDLTPNSGLVLDACGECDGDGSTCAGCDGESNSGAIYDGCNICAGDSSSCAGCDNVPNSGAIVDACNVCGGDSSSCLDLCGAPNGDSTTCAGCDGLANSGLTFDACGECGGPHLDACPTPCDGVRGHVSDTCGVCQGDGASCAGCDGVAFSGAALDFCDVCGGDSSTCTDSCGVPNGDGTSCNGCDGLPNSGKLLDACGYCGGTNRTCVWGCDHGINSGLVYDACRMCDGDGSSCAGCDGVAYSGKAIDDCGVCGGDGSTCRPVRNPPTGTAQCNSIAVRITTCMGPGGTPDCNRCDSEAIAAQLDALDCRSQSGSLLSSTIRMLCGHCAEQGVDAEAACCPNGGCAANPPSSCSPECAAALLPFYQQCPSVVAPTSAGSGMSVLARLRQQCVISSMHHRDSDHNCNQLALHISTCINSDGQMACDSCDANGIIAILDRNSCVRQDGSPMSSIVSMFCGDCSAAATQMENNCCVDGQCNGDGMAEPCSLECAGSLQNFIGQCSSGALSQTSALITNMTASCAMNSAQCNRQAAGMTRCLGSNGQLSCDSCDYQRIATQLDNGLCLQDDGTPMSSIVNLMCSDCTSMATRVQRACSLDGDSIPNSCSLECAHSFHPFSSDPKCKAFSQNAKFGALQGLCAADHARCNRLALSVAQCMSSDGTPDCDGCGSSTIAAELDSIRCVQSDGTPMSSIVEMLCSNCAARTTAMEQVCCAEGSCAGTVPTGCSIECATVFNIFYADCPSVSSGDPTLSPVASALKVLCSTSQLCEALSLRIDECVDESGHPSCGSCDADGIATQLDANRCLQENGSPMSTILVGANSICLDCGTLLEAVKTQCCPNNDCGNQLPNVCTVDCAGAMSDLDTKCDAVGKKYPSFRAIFDVLHNLCIHPRDTGLCESLSLQISQCIDREGNADCGNCHPDAIRKQLQSAQCDQREQGEIEALCMPCSASQHQGLTECLGDCEACDRSLISRTLGTCALESGVGAVQLVSEECMVQVPCSELQHAIVARCIANCAACDRITTGTILGACTVGSKSGTRMIASTCRAAIPLGHWDTGGPEAGSSGSSVCSRLQTAVMTECSQHCESCNTENAFIILNDCIIGGADGSAAKETIHRQCSASSQRGPARTCSDLQQAVIRECAADCAGCNKEDVGIVLNECRQNGRPQISGITFCAVGETCTELQHAVLARCIANCDTCDVEKRAGTKTVLSDCTIASVGSNEAIRAEQLISTECALGQSCSGLQQAVLARCLQNCEACDKISTGAVLGACTLGESYDGAAINMISQTCNNPQQPCVGCDDGGIFTPSPPPFQTFRSTPPTGLPRTVRALSSKERRRGWHHGQGGS